jgi:hypothetical protein
LTIGPKKLSVETLTTARPGTPSACETISARARRSAVRTAVIRGDAPAATGIV